MIRGIFYVCHIIVVYQNSAVDHALKNLFIVNVLSVQKRFHILGMWIYYHINGSGYPYNTSIRIVDSMFTSQVRLTLFKIPHESCP